MADDAPGNAFIDLSRTGADPELQRVREVAFAALRLAPGQRILDAGTGAGEAARLLAARLGGTGEVVAVDHRRGDVIALDFPGAYFDAVRCERVLQHLADPDAAVAELARVTRPGGRVCLVDTDWESVAVDGLPRGLVAAVRGHLLATVVRRHLDMGRTLRRRLVRAGLREVTAVPVALYFADPISAATVLPMVNPMIPPAAGLIPPELREDWFGALSEAGERGDFLATLTMWVATATA
ncbi:methyltransferase domain-containing protein [Dactylosporangium sp. NPDC048998]|uniref:methyltransferase domain-containing protein n=1 Tax=Dactylosporangium sp. NPDC048998 TaxID=3363976 RepID=UPI003722FAF8